MISRRICKRCGAERDCELSRQISEAGAVYVLWVCVVCGDCIPDKRGRTFIPHDDVRSLGIDIDTLPLRKNDAMRTRCARCGERGAQLHHWAPKAIFGRDEAESWPMDLLCQRCHELWHGTMGTPHAHRKEGA